MDYLAPLTVVVMLIVNLVAGIYIGITAYQLRCRRLSKGRLHLRIDHSFSDEPAMMFVELKDVTPDMLAKEKIVMFEVINENYLSHD